MRRLIALPLLLAACSEYNLNGGAGLHGADDTGPGGADGGGGGPGGCGEVDLSPADVGVDEACEAPAEVGSWTPVIEWTASEPGNTYTTPVVGQLTDDNGDGRVDSTDTPDVVVANTSGVIYALSGAGGAVLWQYSGMGSEPSTPAIADLDADGRPEVVATGSTGWVALDGASGAQIWRQTAQASGVLVCGGVGVYDLDADGYPEVVQGRTILDGRTGAVRAIGTAGNGTGHSNGYAGFGVAADIDQDGDLEVVVGNALYDAEGRAIWTTSQSDGFVAVGNFDEDPQGEIVVTWFPGMVRLQDDDGTILWAGSFTGSTIGPPTVADFDGDGRPEVGVAGNGVYVVIEHDGTRKWSRNINDYSSGFTGSAVFDFEGDGQAEVVFADEQDVWVFDGATGAVKMQESRHSSATCSEYPAIADVDNDGHAEIIYTSSQYSGNERGVTVIGDRDDSWMPAAGTWNQHAYHITNVEDDAGGIPAVPESNWLTYNNFRSGDLSAATGGALSDAVPVEIDVCTDECDAGHLYVSVQLGNTGLSALPAGVPVSLYSQTPGGWELIETRWSEGEIDSGLSARGWTFDLDPATVGDTLKLVVDDDNGSERVVECNETNNEWIISPLCP